MEETEKGEIIKVDGPLVSVKMRMHESCAACGQKALCFPVGNHRVLLARAKGDIHKGDIVTIVASSGPAILSALLIFIVPIVLGLGLLLLGRATGSVLWLTLTTMGAVLLLYFLSLILLNNRLKKSGWFLPRAEKTNGVWLEPKGTEQ